MLDRPEEESLCVPFNLSGEINVCRAGKQVLSICGKCPRYCQQAPIQRLAGQSPLSVLSPTVDAGPPGRPAALRSQEKSESGKGAPSLRSGQRTKGLVHRLLASMQI